MPSRAEFYSRVVYPAFSKMDPEASHERAIRALQLLESNPFLLKVAERVCCNNSKRFKDPTLAVEVGGIELENPVILAAGFTKNAKGIRALKALGFSSIVAGTVTVNSQKGKDKPRIFRPTSDALINRMGFPNDGLQAVKHNLSKYQNRNFPIGISIGPNREIRAEEVPDQYRLLSRELDNLVDYFEINVSSPNTEGLRAHQAKESLEKIIKAVREETTKPLFLKISPDLTVGQLDEIIQIATDHNLAIVATNTSTNKTIKSSLGEHWKSEQGGVSGAPIEKLSNLIIKHITDHSSVDVVGCGGVRDIYSAKRKFNSGAKAIQIYSGLVTRNGGPDFPSRLVRELSEFARMGS